MVLKHRKSWLKVSKVSAWVHDLGHGPDRFVISCFGCVARCIPRACPRFLRPIEFSSSELVVSGLGPKFRGLGFKVTQAES